MTNETVTCLTPQSSVPGLDGIGVSLNGQQFTAPLPFHFYLPPSIASLSPSTGPAAGGTRVKLLGTGYTAFQSQICHFAPGVHLPFEFKSLSLQWVLVTLRGCASHQAQRMRCSAQRSRFRIIHRLKDMYMLGTANDCTSCLPSAALQLTPPLPTSTGTLAVPAPSLDAHALKHFEVDFEVHVRSIDHRHGEGFSWSYAAGVAEPAGAHGVSTTGISACF